MWVRFHAPFGDGRTWQEIPIAGSLSLRELLGLLQARCPGLDRFTGSGQPEAGDHLLLFRGDHMLGETDRVQPEDRIVVMLPLHGG